ncbi:MAG TPA: hypothetical protein VF060_32570 [Trebonia sp.]
MRGGKCVVVLAGIAVLAAGCATKTAPRPVSLTAAVIQTRAQTAEIAVSTSMQTQGMSMTFTETGSFDFAHSRGSITTGEPIDMTMLFLPPHVYLRVPGGDGTALPEGKSWVDIDTATSGWSGAASAVNGAAGGLLPGNTSPADMLAALTAVSGSVRKLGPGSVRGVPVTGFRVIVDTAKAAVTLPKANRADFEGMMGSPGAREIPVDVWVDSHNLVRRMRMSLPLPDGVAGSQGITASPGTGTGTGASQSASAAQGAVYTETTDFYDFGVQVRVVAPPASQVASMSQLNMEGSSSASTGSGGSASPPKEAGTLSASQTAAAGQAVSAFWSALGRNDPAAFARTVLPAQRGCVSSVTSGAPKITVSGLRITSVRAAGAGKATVWFSVSAHVDMKGQSIPVLPEDPGARQWLVAAEKAGHWYVDLGSNADFFLAGC